MDAIRNIRLHSKNYEFKAKYDSEGNEISTTYSKIVDLNSHKNDTNNPHNVTKQQIGLSNVDNTSDLDKPISTATQQALNLKQNVISTTTGGSGEVTQTIDPNKLYKFGEVSTLNITLGSEIPNIYNEYMFEFISGSTPTVLTLPETVKWIGSDNIEANKTYQVSIVNNLAVMGGV